MRILAALALCLLQAGCSLRSNLPVLGVVPAFELTAENGETFHSAELTGQVWVADFFFTTCNGPCPRMSAQMRQIQESTRDLRDVRLISFTIDHATDTPGVLAAYARRYRADRERWRFLTGASQDLHRLSHGAFRLAETGGALDHSSRFALVDRKGRIRAYYDTSATNSIPRIVADILKLRKELL